MDEDAIASLAQRTDGFSFAYLKELFVASTMRWIDTPGERAMASVMHEQLGVLRAQLTVQQEMVLVRDHGASDN